MFNGQVKKIKVGVSNTILEVVCVIVNLTLLNPVLGSYHQHPWYC